MEWTEESAGTTSGLAPARWTGGLAMKTTSCWIKATMAEAYAGLGDTAMAKNLLEDARKKPEVKDWMIQTTEEQIEKLRKLSERSPLNRISSTPAT